MNQKLILSIIGMLLLVGITTAITINTNIEVTVDDDAYDTFLETNDLTQQEAKAYFETKIEDEINSYKVANETQQINTYIKKAYREQDLATLQAIKTCIEAQLS